MIRRHKTLENMVEVAQNNGESNRNGWVVTMKRDSVYTHENGYKQATFDKQGREIVKDTYTFIHWGTPILEITQQGNLLNGYETSYDILYGESVSDSRAINAMLEYFGIYDVKTTFRPVNGGFIILDMSENISQIQSDMCKHASENIRKNAPWILS